MKIKNFIRLSLLIVIISFGCNGKESKSSYTVTGVIKNAPKQKMILQEFKFVGVSMVSETLDTITTDENGKFNFDFIAKGDGLYSLAINKDEGKEFRLFFINDEKQIQINGDYENYKSIFVSGSKSTETLYKFLKEYDKKNELFVLSINNLSVMQNINGDAAIIDSLQKDRFTKMNDLNNYILTTINESSNPTFIQFVLIQSLRLPIETSLILEYARVAAEKTKSENLKNFVTALSNQVKINVPTTPLSVGQPAPEIAMADPNGNIKTLSSLRGKYVLVDFWASWCGPCRAENPNVVSAFEKFKDKRFTVLGVSLDDDKGAWTDAIKVDKLNWLHISDLKKWESTVVNTYQFEGIPYNVLIDTNGIIIAKELRGNALQEKLASILN
jgi:peroxiredoxin